MASDTTANLDGGSTTLENTIRMLETDQDHGHQAETNSDKMRTLEIEMDDDIQDTLEADVSLDESEAEETGLIRNDYNKAHRVIRQSKICDYQKIEHSNCHVVFPRFFYNSGFGMVGPHWFGPLCILAILAVASYMFTVMGFHNCGPLTGAMSIMFTSMVAYNLLNTSLRDPGLVILKRQEPPLEEVNAEENIGSPQGEQQGTPAAPRRRRQRWCWCEVCQAHQPPDAAHCPDCNVCIRGFDHHCVWMGVCIGRDNFKQFLRFNLSWLGYLAYCIIWVSLVGPSVSSKARHAASGEA
jgi:hypothetical protein